MICRISKYYVRPEKVDEFRTFYDSDGDWVMLFSAHEGYFGTVLMEDAESCAFVTVDFWKAAIDFERCQSGNQQRYTDLDAMCETLTISEQYVGSFDVPDSLSLWTNHTHLSPCK